MTDQSQRLYPQDTIVAVATAPGRGGIGIVRVSGPLAESILKNVTGREVKPRYAKHCRFLDDEGEPIDDGVVLFFPGPDSFTGEDVVEFQGHGSPVVADMLVSRCIALGARIAAPGEFSQRAFLNDKIDLAQAEAIADLIASASVAAARGATRSLQGAFSSRINELVAELTSLRVFVEAAIDFPEEEIDFLSDERVTLGLREIQDGLDRTTREASQGQIILEGASVVLAGRPNAGKSSLMNCLTQSETSIVTEVPGTTRDIVNQAMQLDGIPLHLVDTAGIRESDEIVEAEGIRRAQAAIASADLVILVIDASLDEATRSAHLKALTDEIATDAYTLVLNKADLVDEATDLAREEFADAVVLSCKQGDGLDSLKNKLKQQLGYDAALGSNFTARARHVDALERAGAAVERGARQLKQSGAGELLAEELKIAQDCLGEITGVVTADDLLGEIFSSFCIGK